MYAGIRVIPCLLVRFSIWQASLERKGDTVPPCNKCFFSIAEPIFGLEDKLLPVYNMASSGLKKILFYIILRHLKGVWEIVMTNNIFFILIFVKSFLRQMLCLFII